ncbi:MAG: DHA2 family efflux MFS transporter permease subunit [Anaerotardibacter sp.]
MKRVIVLVTLIILGSSFGNLSQTASNAMFSGMAADFGVDVGLGQWVTTLYMLVLGITVLLVAYLMRRFALKTIILAAFAFLLAGAVIDSIAWDFASLLVGRVLQAIAAGITMPMMMSVIMTSFPREVQATVMGISGIAMGFAPNVGPTIGGFMVEFAGWRSFFVLLVVATVILIVCAILFIQTTSKPEEEAHLDVASFILSAVGFCSMLLGFSNASSFEISNPFVWGPVVVGCVLVFLFVVRQRKITQPLISMEIFSSKRYVISFIATIFLNASFMGITLILPLFIENIWGGNAFEGGLSLVMGCVVALFINPLAGVLTDKIGIKPVAVVGSVFLFVGAASMVFINESTPFWMILALQGIRQLGVSSLIGPLTSWGLACLPFTIMTDGSSFNTAARQVSASLGTALMVFAITLAPLLGSAELAYALSFGISALFALGTMIVCIMWINDKVEN